MRVGVVVIGRNEGERLVRCLASLPGGDTPVVYVDSGSTDASVANATSAGADVVTLDPDVPFTAARSRNAGRRRLRETHPDLDAIFFIDGDCTLNPDFIDAATKVLAAEPKVAVVSGRRAERHPEHSIYNRLCDIEWAIPAGDSVYFGGDALVRLRPFDDAGGYDPAVIAGEEPDLAWKMRSAGWTIRVIDHPMTTHDAAITRFSQWWRRSVRAGHAHIAMAARHGVRVTPYNPRGVITTLVWSIAIPITTLALAAFVHPLWSLLALAYPAQWARLTVRTIRSGIPLGTASAYALSLLIAKWAETAGYIRWATQRALKRGPRLIEYKSARDA